MINVLGIFFLSILIIAFFMILLKFIFLILDPDDIMDIAASLIGISFMCLFIFMCIYGIKYLLNNKI